MSTTKFTHALSFVIGEDTIDMRSSEIDPIEYDDDGGHLNISLEPRGLMLLFRNQYELMATLEFFNAFQSAMTDPEKTKDLILEMYDSSVDACDAQNKDILTSKVKYKSR